MIYLFQYVNTLLICVKNKLETSYEDTFLSTSPIKS